MKKVLFIVGLHFALACVLYAATNSTEPKTTLAPEDTQIARADFPAQNAFICLYKQGGEIALNGRTYFIEGQTTVDQFGGAAIIVDTLTKNAITILPDGSADLYLNGVQYRFSKE